ncbi:glycosyltransferase family A protein [Clostridium sp. BL-8]|uniref:glycosyltransferase family A protein n=1 Tax=Clostridium sp. BL-8 TaxID=349938 RepID=UPI00098C534B|nr:glycosyltransferase family A protein [Clostridium sp. BL-8]OOM79961.1 putative glycosyltransferase EpsJ [Clostridium sp. BL-8]
MTKISVIIPIYNMGLYLEECLKSVMMQTLKDIEVICINDGSTDNSLEILERYSLVHNNIIILNQENCGVARARNNGINIANGEFVVFMDPDDYYPENDILECLYNSAKENNVYICGGSYSSFRNGKIITSYYGWLKDFTFTSYKKVNFKEYQCFFGFQRFIYNLEFLKKNDIYFPLYVRYEDPPFLVRAMICAKEFYSIKKITYCYRTGYKRVILTLRKTIDYAKGVLDVLNISKEHGLKKLQAIVLETMRDDLSSAIYKHIAEGNLELRDLLCQINSFIENQSSKEIDKAFSKIYLLEPQQITEHIKKNMIKEKEFIHTLQEYKKIIIYGACRVAETVADYLKSIDGINIICFAVTDASKNPSNIYDIPVRNINEITSYNENSLVLIATFTNHHQEIRNKLEELQFKNVLPIYFDELQLFGTSIK